MLLSKRIGSNYKTMGYRGIDKDGYFLERRKDGTFRKVRRAKRSNKEKTVKVKTQTGKIKQITQCQLDRQELQRELREWKFKVFDRDRYTCQECESTVNLHAHHIKSFRKFPELRLKINNGITLCKDCHNKKHKWMYSGQIIENDELNNAYWVCRHAEIIALWYKRELGISET